MIKNETVLTTIIRVFIDNFLNYYFEELIYTIRTINKKEVTDLTVFKYRFKFIKCLDNEEENLKEEKEKDKEKKNKKEVQLDKNDVTQVKNLDNLNQGSSWVKSSKKYNMRVKKLKDEDKKNFDPLKFLEKINKDYKLFADFFEGFKENSKEPFTKAYDCVLGENFINTYLNKFNAAIEVIKISKKGLMDFIKSTYKEYFHGTEGKNIMEILLFTRKDAKDFLSNSEKKVMNDLYDARIS